MRQLFLFSLLLSTLLVAVVPVAAADGCTRPQFKQPATISDDAENYTYIATSSITFQTGSDCAVRNNVAWEQKWEWEALSCQPASKYNRSLVFRNLSVAITTGVSVRIQNFSLWNKNLSMHPLFSFGDIYIPETQQKEKQFPVAANRPMNANILTTGGPNTTASALLVLDSVSNSAIDVEVSIFFECARIRRYISDKSLSEESGGFGSIFAAYILPFLVVGIIMIIALIRWCRPDVTASVKNWAGFRELDDESRTRHTKIKDKSGGNTWIDHADKVVTDLQRAKVDKIEARHDDQELQDMNDNNSRVSSAVPAAAALSVPPAPAPPTASANNNAREDASSAISGMSGVMARNNNNNNNEDDF